MYNSRIGDLLFVFGGSGVAMYYDFIPGQGRWRLCFVDGYIC